MAEEADLHLLLVTGPQELARARESQAQDARQAAARRERGRRLLGNPAARAALTGAWSAVSSRAPLGGGLKAATVYEGEGPPTDPPPAGVPLGAWYLDKLTGTLYRLEA